MSDQSYSLREVAELLGVSKRTLQRRIQEGAFPGRYLAPGIGGLEMRIPVADVDRARAEMAQQQHDVRATRTLAPAPADSVLPYRSGEVEAISSAPIYRESLERAEVQEIRDVVLHLVREEREMFLSAVRDALIVRDREVADLRQEIIGLKTSIETMRSGLERFERRLESEWQSQSQRPPAWSEVLGVEEEPNRVDVDDLLRELGELEAMVSVLPVKA